MKVQGKNAATYSMIVSQVLADRRDQRGLSQAAFLEAAGITPSTWSRVARGISFFSLEELRALCSVLDRSVGEITTEADAIARNLMEHEEIEILENKKAKDNMSIAGVLIAGAALAFLISRLRK